MLLEKTLPKIKAGTTHQYISYWWVIQSVNHICSYTYCYLDGINVGKAAFSLACLVFAN